MLKFSPLFLCFLSCACLATEPERYSTGIDSAEQQVLQQLDSSFELLDIQTDSDRFSLLYRLAMTPEPRGALLILPDTGADGAWLEQVRALAEYLPEHGWTLMALEPPPVPLPAIPERTNRETDGVKPEPTASDEASRQETPPTAYSERLQQRLELAWQELEQRTGDEPLILASIGRAAPWSLPLAIAKGEEVTLLLIDPLPDSAAGSSLIELLPQLASHQVIDLYHAPLPGYPGAEPDARQRRLLAARLGMSGYQQSRLPGVFRGWRSDMPWLTRQTRGLLERSLTGEEPEDEIENGSEQASLVQTPPGQRPAPANGTP